MRLLEAWKMNTGRSFLHYLTAVFQEQEKLQVKKEEFRVNHRKYVMEANV